MNRIRALREDRDLRQVDVAAATGIDQKTLSNYETGKTRPDSDALTALADFFSVSVDYLIGRVDVDTMSRQDIVREVSAIQRSLERLKKRL